MTEPDSSGWQEKGQQAQVEIQAILLKHRKNVFIVKMVEEVAQRGCGVPILGDTQNQQNKVLSNLF